MESQKNNTPNFSQGFLLGVIVGVVVTLLLVTKKGRRILRTIADEGFEHFTELQKNMQSVRDNVASRVDEAVEEEVVPEDEAFVATEPKEEKKEASSKNGVKKSVRKLFKGIPRKSQ